MPLLGDRLRELRVDRNLTLKQVSEETGLSVSFLSLVERDKVSISVDNLERLARFYKVRLVHLFQGVEDSSVLITRKGYLQKHMSSVEPNKSAFSLLSYRNGARMEPLMVRIAPGQGDSHFRTHEGDMFIYVLEGRIKLIAEKGEPSELEEGDAAYYTGFPGRRLINASQENPALILMVTAPPTSLRDDALDGRRGLLIPQEDSAGGK
jgi:transcriptional regulator with XRE-family HTH domain